MPLLLGTRTMTCANASATLPFGAIDTPAQGGTASGAGYVNFGWALTPLPKTIPINGSTITVLVDGVAVGHGDYNHFRPDIAGLFPGCNNIERRDRVPGSGHHGADKRDAHDRVGRERQPGRDRRDREPLLHGLEWRRRADGGDVAERGTAGARTSVARQRSILAERASTCCARSRAPPRPPWLGPRRATPLVRVGRVRPRRSSAAKK